MFAENMELQGLEATPAVPDWLRGFIRALRGQAIQPKDERVRQLWNLMRQRQVLRRSIWVRGLLRRIWNRGLAARPRPITTRRLIMRLRHWGILPPRATRLTQTATRQALPVRPLRPPALRPIRPVVARPLRPVAARPVAARPVAARPVTAPRR
jgi:hypothetical protein